jgi:hypothetical protein
VDVGVWAIIRSIEACARHDLPEALRPPSVDGTGVEGESLLAFYLETWCRASPRPVVLFLDEIDALHDESLVSVLRQLRRGFAGRPAAFPQSVALIGLRDVRDYKVRSAVRPEATTLGTASPFNRTGRSAVKSSEVEGGAAGAGFNVKAEALTLRSFTQTECRALLGQHTAETGQVWAEDAMSEVFEQSQGQPWLSNALASLCTTHATALVPDRSVPVTREHVLQVREILIQRRDTHLDSLVDRLREERVRKVIEPILVGASIFDPTFDDDFAYVRDLGLVARREGEVVIANPIYQEILPRVLCSHVQAGIADKPAWFVAPDGTLDLPKLIEGFLAFWRRNGEVLLKGMPYQEAAPHLVFMAYLQRIVNAGGRITREFAVGTGRADLVVEYHGRQDVIELKLQHDRHTLPEGLAQVARYAQRLGRDRAYLVLFDRKASTPWEDRGQVEQVEVEGVRVAVVRA